MVKNEEKIIENKRYGTAVIIKKNTSPQTRLMIGIPTTGLVRTEWMCSRYGQITPCNWSSSDLLINVEQVSPMNFLVADARNIIVKKFVEDKAEWLFFIDSDVCLPPDCFVRINDYIIEGKIPVVGGIYFTKSIPSEPLIYRGRGTGHFRGWKLGDKVWVDGMGMGCFPAGTKVHLNCTWENIESIKPGNFVLSHNGNLQNVYATNRRFYSDCMIRIKTAKFSIPIELTTEHPVLAVKGKKSQKNGFLRKPNSSLRPYDKYSPTWINAGDLTDEHIVLYRINRLIERKYRIKLSDEFKNCIFKNGCVGFPNRNKYQVNWIRNDIDVDKNLMRLIGYYLAEGEARDSMLTFSFHKKELEYITDVKNLMNIVFGLEKVYENERNNGRRLIFSSKILCEWFRGQFGHGAKNKKIPKWSMLLPLNLQIELLKGYLRGDGCYDLKGLRRNISCNSISEDLILQLREIFLRLGYIPSHTKEYNHGKENKNRFRFGLHILGKQASDLLKRIEPDLNFPHKIVKENDCEAWIADGYLWLPIRKIEKYHYDGDVFNLSVENDESYIVSGFVVHNCTLIHRSLLEVMYNESEEYPIPGGTVRKVFETPTRVFIDPETGGVSTSSGTEDLAWMTRIMEEGIFKKAGWAEYQRKKYPFLIDTNIFSWHISPDGEKYPLRGEHLAYLKQAKEKEK